MAKYCYNLNKGSDRHVLARRKLCAPDLTGARSRPMTPDDDDDDDDVFLTPVSDNRIGPTC